MLGRILQTSRHRISSVMGLQLLNLRWPPHHLRLHERHSILLAEPGRIGANRQVFAEQSERYRAASRRLKSMLSWRRCRTSTWCDTPRNRLNRSRETIIRSMPQDAKIASSPNTFNLPRQPDWTNNGNERHHAIPHPQIRRRQRRRHNQTKKTPPHITPWLLREYLHSINGYIGDRRDTRDGQEKHIQRANCDVAK
jgi:hypothetical protein